MLGRGETTFAVVMAGPGLGSSLAGILLGRATGRVLLGLILLPGMLKPPLLVFGVLWFFNGEGQALIAIPSSTLLTEHTFEEERGRAYVAHFALTHACRLVTYTSVGHAAASWGPPLTFTAAGVLCLGVAAAALLFGRRAEGAHTHDRRKTSAPTG